VDTTSVTIEVAAPSRVWRVPGDVPTIQAAIDSAAVGDTVLVACEVYYESSIALAPGVVLMNETGDPDCVTIDGGGRGDRVLECIGVGDATVIRGLTLTGGNSDGSGGALLCQDASPLVSDCVIFGNSSASSGGGVACTGTSSPSFANCTVVGNDAQEGAGVYVADSS